MAPYDSPLGRNEIRLLILLPGQPGDDVKCDLQTVSLDNKPMFEALSYVWGNDKDSVPIVVQRRQWQIKPNLDMALRALRHSREERRLWIDALCIDQSNMNEKSDQIALMGTIYCTALRVIAWLGPSTAEIELYTAWLQNDATWTPDESAVKLLESGSRSSNLASPNQPLDQSLHSDGAADSPDTEREKDVALLRVIQGYAQLADMPYWSRVWTFQEWHLPTQAPVLICGNCVMQRSDLSDSQGRIWQLLSEVVTRLIARDHSGKSAHYPESESAVLREIEKLPALKPFPELEIKEKTQSMSFLLRHTVRRQCSNPLDKVFGLYGMCPTLQLAYKPDYGKSVERVLRETTAFMINNEHYLHFYCVFGMRKNHIDAVEPSWVPDFSQDHLTMEANRFPRYFSFQIDENPGNALYIEHGECFGDLESATVPAEVDDTILQLSAKRIGALTVCMRFEETYPKVLEQLQLLLEENSASSILGDHVRVTGAALVQRMAGACFIQEPKSVQYTAQEILAGFNTLFASLDRKEGAEALLPPNDLANLCRRAASDLAGKTVFTTDNGLFGIGPDDVHSGDVLIVSPEVRMPLILRPRKRETKSGVRGDYRLVGTCYVDGIMAHVALDENAAAEVRGVEQTVFEIW